MMVKIYGSSDDLVCLDNSNYTEDEIGCYDVAGVWLFLEDDTVLLTRYCSSTTPTVSGASMWSKKAPCRMNTGSAPERMMTTTVMSF